MMHYKVIIVATFLLFSCAKKDEYIVPRISDLTESVYASVIIQPDSLYQVYATVNGILETNLVEEGDIIKKGAPILHIKSTISQLNTKNAILALDLAQENFSGEYSVLRGLEEDIKGAELVVKNDSINFFRQKRLWSENIGSKIEFDNRELAYSLSVKKLNSLKNRYDITKNDLFTKLQQALNNVKTSKELSNEFTVYSKINGAVYALFKEPGEIVSPMEPLASLGSEKKFVIEMLIDEVDIVKLFLKQKTIITLDAYGNDIFTAKISKIYPRKDERSQTFKVEAIFDESPTRLYPGLAGEGNIVVSELKNIMTVPKDYVINENEVLTENGAVEVTIGIQGLDRVQILSGIDKDTKLFKPE